MTMQLNRPGPRTRDLDRMERAAKKAAEQRKLTAIIEVQVASTGTRYMEVMIDGQLPRGTDHPDASESVDIDGKPFAWLTSTRVYRFAAHAECYTTHDYSVWSGGACRRNVALPPGYDGRVGEAIDDMKAWIETLPAGL